MRIAVLMWLLISMVTMVDPSLLAALKILHTLKLMEALPYLLTDIRRLTQRLMKRW